MLGSIQQRLTYANVMATVAVFLALGGGAYAALRLPPGSVGTREMKDGAVTSHKLARGAVNASKVANSSLTGQQINVSTLGIVPNAKHASSADGATNATHATNADNATNANHATSSDTLAGSPASAFQASVTGSCSANSAIEQIHGDGSVVCGKVQFYGGRIIEPLNGTDTFLTIPGVAHVASETCTAANANASLHDDALGTTEIWSNNDSSHTGTSWSGVATTLAPAAGETWHLGQGSGAGAKVITLTVSTAATGTSCVLQGWAEVITT